MTTQIENYNIKKAQRSLAFAIKHIVDASEAVSEINEEWKPERLGHTADFLLDIASGLMEIYDNYASELLYPR